MNNQNDTKAIQLFRPYSLYFSSTIQGTSALDSFLPSSLNSCNIQWQISSLTSHRCFFPPLYTQCYPLLENLPRTRESVYEPSYNINRFETFRFSLQRAWHPSSFSLCVHFTLFSLLVIVQHLLQCINKKRCIHVRFNRKRKRFKVGV